jgi:hypothetical protein
MAVNVRRRFGNTSHTSLLQRAQTNVLNAGYVHHNDINLKLMMNDNNSLAFDTCGDILVLSQGTVFHGDYLGLEMKSSLKARI